MVEKNNRLFDTGDSIDFGQMKNEPFKWIYLLCTPYLVWLIEETDICFTNLNLFYQFGKPLRIDEKFITESKKNQISILVRQIGKNIYSKKGSERYILTVEIFSKIIEKKILTPNAFNRIDFEFSEVTINKNDEKIKFATGNYFSCNNSRDIYLNDLFRI